MRYLKNNERKRREKKGFAFDGFVLKKATNFCVGKNNSGNYKMHINKISCNRLYRRAFRTSGRWGTHFSLFTFYISHAI